MPRSAREIIGWTVSARGGPAGIVRDLLVDDGTWRVRHLVVETLALSRARHALVAPQAVRRLNKERQIEQSEVSTVSDIECDPPIAVQEEHLHHDTAGWR